MWWRRKNGENIGFHLPPQNQSDIVLAVFAHVPKIRWIFSIYPRDFNHETKWVKKEINSLNILEVQNFLCHSNQKLICHFNFSKFETGWLNVCLEVSIHNSCLYQSHSLGFWKVFSIIVSKHSFPFKYQTWLKLANGEFLRRWTGSVRYINKELGPYFAMLPSQLQFLQIRKNTGGKPFTENGFYRLKVSSFQLISSKYFDRQTREKRTWKATRECR